MLSLRRPLGMMKEVASTVEVIHSHARFIREVYIPIERTRTWLWRSLSRLRGLVGNMRNQDGVLLDPGLSRAATLAICVAGRRDRARRFLQSPI